MKFSFILCLFYQLLCKINDAIHQKKSENMSNVLKENANIEINEKTKLLLPASQIKVRFLVECTSVNTFI